MFPYVRPLANQSDFYDTQKNECLWYLMVSCALHPNNSTITTCVQVREQGNVQQQMLGFASASFCLQEWLFWCYSQLDFSAVGVIVCNEKLCQCRSKCCFHGIIALESQRWLFLLREQRRLFFPNICVLTINLDFWGVHLPKWWIVKGCIIRGVTFLTNFMLI